MATINSLRLDVVNMLNLPSSESHAPVGVVHPDKPAIRLQVARSERADPSEFRDNQLEPDASALKELRQNALLTLILLCALLAVGYVLGKTLVPSGGAIPSDDASCSSCEPQLGVSQPPVTLFTNDAPNDAAPSVVPVFS